MGESNSSSSWLGGMSVAGILVLLLIATIIWQAFYKEKRQDDRALTAELCNTRTILGTQGAAIQANREFLGYQVPRLDELSYDYAYTRGKFASGIARNTADIDRLDGAVFVPRCGVKSGCGTGRSGGRPEFREVTNFVQEGVATIRRTQGCGSEFN